MTMISDFRLEVFAEVARRASFSRAAEVLHISQPAVTKHIKELEKQVGHPLFRRKGSTIRITQEGITLLEYAKAILLKYKELNNAFAEDITSYRGRLRLGASTTLAQYVLPVLLARFGRQYPNVQVELVSGNSEEIVRLCLDGSIDLGMVEGDKVHPSLQYQVFSEDELILVRSARSKFKIPPVISLERLRSLPLVVRETGSGTLSVLDHALQRNRLDRTMLSVKMQLGSTEGILRYLEAADCLAFVSACAVTSELEEGKLQPIRVEGLSLYRTFRFASLHGSGDVLSEIFRSFCLNNYNKKL